MSTNALHEMMPVASHDEFAQQSFLLAFKTFVEQELDPLDKQLCNEVAMPAYAAAQGQEATRSQDVRPFLAAQPFHQFWQASLRGVQELMWDNVGDSVDRQLDGLNSRFRNIQKPKGSLRLDPNFKVPDYIAAFDNHRMPGSYYSETDDQDVRAGALFDRSAMLYHLKRNGGGWNDARGHTLIDHVLGRDPDFKPRRILDMGCTVGHSTLAYCDKFPAAEIHAIDIGAPILRYAHARAETVGKTIHFSQQSAEHTDFDDQSFDLIVSTAMLHETNRPAVARIFKECHRLLAPGGIMAHLEVPVRYDELGVWEQVRVDWESQVNNEPFMGGIARLDYADFAAKAGFDRSQAVAGYQWQVPGYIPGKSGFDPNGGEDGKLKMGSWYVFSAIR